jgi:hypothetical protein
MPPNSPNIKGVSTIVWGTEGQLGSPSGAIVESISINPKNGGGIGEIENGDGAGVIDVLLDDGFDAKVTCIYDKAKTWPVTGGAVTLTIPTPTGAGGTTAYVCYATGWPSINTARKKEATIELALRFRPGISAT